MKKKWLGIMSAVCIVGMLIAVPSTFASDVPDINGLHNGKKEVKHFPHRKHAEHFVKGKQGIANFSKYTDDWTCGACHHKSHKGETPKKCVSCKKEMGGKLKKFMHKNCKDTCHKKTGKSSSGKKLTKCKTCHG